nr:sensor histidine kinase [Gracilibacillus halotolerans]
MLASQINPHFLYNTLEMIRMKALMNKDPEVAQLVKMLSKMMRSSLERTDRLISIEKETELISYYLQIQQMRFGEDFSYHVEVEETLKKYYILPLIIQPLVENAMIHGLEAKEDRGFIRIVLLERKDFLEIEVTDNGVGIPRDTLKEIQERMDVETYQSEGNRIGLHNVQQRIKLYHGKDYGLTIESIHGLGTTVHMKLPKIEHDR